MYHLDNSLLAEIVNDMASRRGTGSILFIWPLDCYVNKYIAQNLFIAALTSPQPISNDRSSSPNPDIAQPVSSRTKISSIRPSTPKTAKSVSLHSVVIFILVYFLCVPFSQAVPALVRQRLCQYPSYQQRANRQHRAAKHRQIRNCFALLWNEWTNSSASALHSAKRLQRGYCDNASFWVSNIIIRVLL